mmetsp:Transcript_8112/g.20768  ORF Transcript_8112/g.20768 Transcript_8112/m.20768 type:complete len:185 (+) Transcript_8112:194-748(+)
MLFTLAHLVHQFVLSSAKKGSKAMNLLERLLTKSITLAWGFAAEEFLKYGFVAIAKEAFDHDAKFITTGEGKDLAELGWFAFYALSMTLFCSVVAALIERKFAKATLTKNEAALLSEGVSFSEMALGMTSAVAMNSMFQTARILVAEKAPVPEIVCHGIAALVLTVAAVVSSKTFGKGKLIKID